VSWNKVSSDTYTALGGVYAYDANNAYSLGNNTVALPLILKWLTDPTLTSVSPAQQVQGWSGTLTLTGTNFQYGMTVTADASGITFGTVTVTGPTSATVPVTIAAAAPLGTRTFYILNPDTGAGSLAGAFSVKAVTSSPSITSVDLNTRDNRPVGYSGPFTITGTDYFAGATVTADDATKIHFSGATVTSSTTITGTITIDSTATTAAHSITVANLDGGIVTGGAFTVNPLPAISSVSPSSTKEGTTLNINIIGSGFLTGLAATNVAISSGVTVNSLTRVGASLLTANITVPSGGPYGPCNVTVTNPDSGIGTGEGVLSVSANVPGPTITNVSPFSTGRGLTADLTLTGSNFATGAAASLGGNGIVVNSTTFGSSTSLTVNATISSDATTGWRTVTVTNTDGGVGSLSNGFLLTTEGLVTVTKLSPSEILVSKEVVATAIVSTPPYVLTGTGFQRNAMVTISNATLGESVASGIVIENVTYVDANHLNLAFAAPTTAGNYSIRVTNPDGTSGVGSGLLSVLAAPNSLKIIPVLNNSQVALPYPSPWNPAAGDLILSLFANEAATITIVAYDLSGAIVFKKDGISILGGRQSNIKLQKADWDAIKGLPADGMLLFIISSNGKTLGKAKVMVYQ